jgi:hypothetical protein
MPSRELDLEALVAEAGDVAGAPREGAAYD